MSEPAEHVQEQDPGTRERQQHQVERVQQLERSLDDPTPAEATVGDDDAVVPDTDVTSRSAEPSPGAGTDPDREPAAEPPD